MNLEKSKKSPKQYSIVTRIVVLLMLVICFQAILSLNTILFTDITTTVEKYSYNNFTRTVVNRKSNLESFMTSGWSNIGEISSKLSDLYQEHSVDGEMSDQEKSAFLSASVGDLIQMISMSGSKGGFLILDDGEEMRSSYSAVYLKSYDNTSHSVNTNTLMLARGPTEVAQKYGFSMVSNWSYGLQLTEESYPILQKPMEASELTKTLDYLGYWHISSDISNSNFQVLTCSMPVFDGEGNPIGVVGVEITQEYLYHFLPENEFGDGSYGYLLATVTEDGSFVPLINHGTLQSTLTPLGQAVSLEDMGLEKHQLEQVPLKFTQGEQDICVYYDSLDLYVNNSPFMEDEIWIVGMVDSQRLTSFTEEFWSVITTMLGVSVGCCLVISYLVGKTVARPILKLSASVSAYDVQTKMVFEPSNLREIGDLSAVIEEMQENILRSALRTDKILALLNKSVGSYEYVAGSGTVAVSGAMSQMLGLREGQSLTQEEFISRLKELRSNPIDEVKNTYAVGDMEIKYYKVEEFHQESVILGVVEDTTKEVEDLLVLNYERNYDLLTGIFNRRAFHQKVTEVMRFEELKVAGFVLFDLDNLKYVNDTFGHDSGDMYIKTAATTIHACLHKYGVVGRMSGDEFYAFLYGFEEQKTLVDSLNALYRTFELEPIIMPNGSEFKIRVSGGLAWYGQDSRDLEELKTYADFAMYKGKHTLKGELRQFDREQYLDESFLLSGKAELNRILDNELLNFVFQPIIDVKTGEIYGYEALMRPVSDILATPTKLLQLATLEGKLWKVEKIAFFKTLSLYKTHQKHFNQARLFINSIPSENLKDEEYQELETLYGDCLANIVVEITEQEQQSDQFITEKLQKLHHLKLDIALDDYGSGYANDIGLIKMNPDVVKIDRSIISNVHVDPSRQAIVHKIITFCKDKNICVLGEGIETEQELEYLVKAGIELAQGYYISRPMELPVFDTSDIVAKIAEIQDR